MVDGKDSLPAIIPKEKWTRKLDFLLSLAGYSVGLGNLWRFPYLCNRNGGGAFLIPFITFLILCGLPLFFLELSVGQFSGKSALHVWKVSPLFVGIGVSMNVVSGMCALYYNVIIAWTLYYLGNSFLPKLPWTSCDNAWNTPTCFSLDECLANQRKANKSAMARNTSEAFGEMYTTSQNVYNNVLLSNDSWSNVNQLNVTAPDSTVCNYTAGKGGLTAAEEFWQYNMLQMSSGVTEVGNIQWHLLLCFMGAWLLIFLCLMKGVKSLGKVVYVTATIPYLLLTIILIRGVTLPGSYEGIIFYLKPDFTKLLHPQVWIEAGSQVFYSLGPAWGLLIVMSSHNKFTNNCLRDAVLITFLGEGTSLYGGFAIFSVLGYMAQKAGVPVSEVVKSGPGLGFIAYPEALTTLPLPQLWNILFFLMLLTVGLDTQFGMTEIICGTVLESFPRQLAKRRTLVTAAICGGFFILGLPLTTSAGVYYFQLMDWYSTSFGLPLIGFVECVVFAWIYGTDRLSDDISMMIGRRPPQFFTICWKFVTPVLLFTTLVSAFVSYQAPTYDKYTYPVGAIAAGWMIGMMSVVPIPIFVVYKFFRASGPFIKRFIQTKKPSADWGPAESLPRDSDFSEIKDPLNRTGELSVSSPSATSIAIDDCPQNGVTVHSKFLNEQTYIS
ncbi:sodium- and chloride-dependent glycine transporter 1-like [Haliotis rufescens]|uniref:sodium- and chloride-dependent glycine transporter 1-like n=1 Tax=Haliotis rufescens TaxID=6454 RepID=UPI001EB02A8E|nr:sodium- and chloride-dependent glycine transporter 1-like [Haliotis rufescens]XP_048253591.1 sodium- and chloride-dependent glycine transporter 1-like [Haliotis rufescens]